MTRYVPSYTEVAITLLLLQIGEVKVPLCMVDLAQTIEEWKDIQSIKVDDQVSADQMTKRGSQICTTPLAAITKSSIIRLLY